MASAATSRSSLPTDWLAPLDGLRGVSILMVLTAHVYRPGWGAIAGRMGVTIFFVLSGFLITRLMLREERKEGAVNLRAFYIRRAFRLFPLYYLVLFAYCVILLGVGGRPELRHGFSRALPYYTFYLQEIPFFRASEPIPFYQSWSLGIEEKFYFVWPILAFQLLRTGKARIFVAALGFLVLSAARYQPFGAYVFPYASILVGCLLALAHDSAPMRVMRAALRGAGGAALAVGFLLALQIGIAVGRSGPVGEIATLLYPLGAAAVLVAGLESPSLGRALSVGPLLELGRLSYAIYLVHLLVRNIVEGALQRFAPAYASGAVVYLAMLVLSVVVARALSAWVETPFRKVGRRLAGGAAVPAVSLPQPGA